MGNVKVVVKINVWKLNNDGKFFLDRTDAIPVAMSGGGGGVWPVAASAGGGTNQGKSGAAGGSK